MQLIEYTHRSAYVHLRVYTHLRACPQVRVWMWVRVYMQLKVYMWLTVYIRQECSSGHGCTTECCTQERCFLSCCLSFFLVNSGNSSPTEWKREGFRARKTKERHVEVNQHGEIPVVRVWPYRDRQGTTQCIDQLCNSWRDRVCVYLLRTLT